MGCSNYKCRTWLARTLSIYYIIIVIAEDFSKTAGAGRKYSSLSLSRNVFSLACQNLAKLQYTLEHQARGGVKRK